MSVLGQHWQVRVNDAELTVIPFIHPRQGQKGWTDPRQTNELFKPLADLIRQRLSEQPRAEFRAAFGCLPL
ncbi:hypothetical protein D3C72_2169160 [compost metagenome]